MARNPTHVVNFSRVDISSEVGRFSTNLAGSIAISDLLADAAYLAWVAALANVIDGTPIAVGVVDTERLSNAKIGSGNREDKWLCVYHDADTLAVYGLELPCRKNTLPLVPGTDTVNLGAVPWIAFKTAFEDFVKSPDGGDTVLDEVRLVGRNV
jgi:hypothetical protein